MRHVLLLGTETHTNFLPESHRKRKEKKQKNKKKKGHLFPFSSWDREQEPHFFSVEFRGLGELPPILNSLVDF